MAGIDEVGCGCLAGPVVAAACILPAEVSRQKWPAWTRSIRDSKELSGDTRAALDVELRPWVRAFAIGICTPLEIDSWNILRATHVAMLRAVAALSVTPDAVLVDGSNLPKEWKPAGEVQGRCPRVVQNIIKGDRASISIAAASIIAKVFRDRHMTEMDALYPGFGFASHKGYSTQEHQAALRELGRTPLHRMSFSPVRQTSRVWSAATASPQAGLNDFPSRLLGAQTPAL